MAYGPVLSLTENETILAIGTIIACVAVINNMSLLVVHSFNFSKSTHFSRLHGLSLVSMALMVLFLIALSLTVYPWAFPITHVADPIAALECRWRLGIANVFWCANKFSLYFLFMERLFAVFENGGDLEFEPRHIRCARIVFGICWAIKQTLVLLFVDGFQSPEWDSRMCLLSPLWIGGLFLMMDFTFCTTISVMFARRLLACHVRTTTRHLARSSTPISFSSTMSASGDVQSPSQNQQNPEVKRVEMPVNPISKEPTTPLKVALNSTILSFVALIASELTIILMTLTGFGHIWMALDSMVNGWCVLLIFKQYNAIFDRMCCLCKRVITIPFMSCYSCHCCCPIR